MRILVTYLNIPERLLNNILLQAIIDNLEYKYSRKFLIDDKEVKDILNAYLMDNDNENRSL